MTPEAQRHLEKAARCLDHARRNRSVGLGNDAARNADLAAFHAAQALIVERTGTVATSHQGVHAEFHRLSRDEPAFDPDSRRFLSKAYSFMAVADYELGPDAEIPPDRAAAALDRARSVVDVVVKVLDADR